MKLDLSELNHQQKDNLGFALASYRNRDITSSHSPPVLFIELTQNCIAKCAFCHGQNWQNQPSFDMSPDIFEIILRDYIPYASIVDLRGRGESLMLSNFPEYLHRIAKHGPKIRLITTLGCGTTDMLQLLVKYDVFVAVSFDAADKDIYESIRCGIKYDTVIKNLEFLTSAMLAKYGTLEDHIRIDICPLQRKNLKSVQGVLELARRLKIKDLLIGPLFDSPRCPDHLNNNKFMTIKAFRHFSDYSKRYGLRYVMTKPPFAALRLDEMTFDLCCHPWLYALITYDGSMLFCDHILGVGGDDPAILGNVRASKEQVWNGQRARSLRMMHIDRTRGLIAQCEGCYREGRYAEFEQILCPEFKRCNFTEKEITLLSNSFFVKKYLLLIEDTLFVLRQWLRTTLQARFPKMYTFLKKVKKR